MNFDSYKASNASVASPANNQDKYTILNDGANALLKESSKTNQIILAGATALVQQNENVKAIDANNFYNQKVSEGMMKIQSKKEGEALNSVEDFKTMEQKAYEETRKKYGKYLYGRTGSIFEQARSRDINTRRQQVEKYQMQEKEKYDNTVLTNGVTSIYTMMGSSLDDEKILADGFGKIDALVEGRYSSYGAEEIVAQKRNMHNKVLKGLVKSAMDGDNYEAANRIINSYGSSLTPEERAPLVKAINSKMKLDQQILDDEALLDKYGDDYEGYMNAVRNNITKYSDNADKLVDIAASMIGKNPKDANGTTLGKVNTCTLLVLESLRQAGMDVGKDGDYWAPTMLKHLEEEGRTFKDKGQLRHGDIVFWETNKNWDDGTDHVGIYDAKTNTVIQSGTSGIARIDLNTYDIHSFAHTRGTEKGMSPSEKQKRIDEASARFKKRQAEKEAVSSIRVKNAQREIGEALANGITDTATFESIINRNTMDVNGNVDGLAYKQLYSIIKTAKTAESKATKFKAEDKAEMQQRLLDGRFSGPTELEEYALRASLQTNDAKWNDAAKEIIDDYNNGKGIFKYDFSGIEAQVMNSYKGPEKTAIWNGIKKATISWINQQRTWKEPTQGEVLAYAESFMSKSIKAGWSSFSPAELFAKYYITDFQPLGDGSYRVKLPGMPGNYHFTTQDINDLRNGVPAIDIVNRHINENRRY